MTVETRHRRYDFETVSADGIHSFSVFLRQSTEFPENFSIGLDYSSSADGTRIHLIRCNGPHGDSGARSSRPPHHFVCHIHRATAENMESGLRPESSATQTDEYTVFEEAAVYFFRYCNILGADTFLPFLEPEIDRQLDLFGESDD